MKLKTVLRVLLFGILLLPITGQAALYYAPSDSFRYEATIKNGQVAVPGAIINVYISGKKIQNKSTNRQGNFFLYLLHNKEYTVEIIKKGFVAQKITIDSKVSDQFLKKGGIEVAFDNEIPIYEYYDGFKTELFDKPVLCYIYNEKTSYFEADRKRSSTQLTSIGSKITASKNKIVTNALKEGNALFKKEMLEEALMEFSKVVEIVPDNPQALEKIKEINKILKTNQAEVNEQYKQKITAADAMLASQKYKEATDNYKFAKALKPENPYPASQIFYIDSLLSQLYAQNKQEFDKFKLAGDGHFKQKAFEKAIENYQQALTLLPDEPIATKQLKLCFAAVEAEKKRIEAEKKALDDKTNALLKKADEQLAQKNYTGAINTYISALELKPGDAEIEKKKETAANLKVKADEEFKQQQIEKNYTDTLMLAEQAFTNKDFANAKTLFETAAIIKPNEKYPTQKARQCELLLSKVQLANQQKDSVENSQAMMPEKMVIDPLTARKMANEGKFDEAINIFVAYAQQQQDNNNLNVALNNLNNAAKIAEQTGNKDAQASIYTSIASVQYDSGMYTQTIKSFEKAIELRKSLNDKPGLAHLYNELGTAFFNLYQYDKAIESYTNSLPLLKAASNIPAYTDALNKTGYAYYSLNNYKKAIEYYKTALNENEKTGNLTKKAQLLNNLGVTYYQNGRYDLAQSYYLKSLTIDSAAAGRQNISITYNNLGNINFDREKYEAALSFYEKSIKIKKELGFEEGLALSFLNAGNTYFQLKKLPQAIDFLNSGLNIAQKFNLRELIKHTYRELAKIYESNNQPKEALEAYRALSGITDIGVFSDGQMSETANMYENESQTIRKLKKQLVHQKILTENEALQNKQKEQLLAIKDMELDRQKTKEARTRVLLIFSLLSAALAGFIAFQYFRRYKEKKRYSDIIGFQKQQITDSITYAGRIQQAVLPPVEALTTVFPDSFIMNRPKDIVSGDYYYVTTIGSKTYILVADCTGHGVPGAFMSMLGISLNKEIIQMPETPPGAAHTLNLLREALMKALHQTGKDEEAKDGMDVALCIIDSNTRQLEYSGANNPCYVVRTQSIIELKADRMPIGIHPVLKPFTSQNIQLEHNDCIYLFSDGFRDQIGGESLKKFRKDQFNKLLVEISILNANNQLARLEEIHDLWKGNMEQTDDILVMGVKI